MSLSHASAESSARQQQFVEHASPPGGLALASDQKNDSEEKDIVSEADFVACLTQLEEMASLTQLVFEEKIDLSALKSMVGRWCQLWPKDAMKNDTGLRGRLGQAEKDKNVLDKLRDNGTLANIFFNVFPIARDKWNQRVIEALTQLEKINKERAVQEEKKAALP